MKYFMLETNEKNRIPYSINKNRAVDIRLLEKDGLGRLPLWNIIEMEFPREGFFPDLLCSPCLLVSETFLKTVLMYHPDVPYKRIKLWDRKSGVNATYFLMVPDEPDAMSCRTEYNAIGNRIRRLVLDKEKTGDRAVFRLKGMDRNCVFGRMDFVESLLRRDVRGIRLSEVEVEGELVVWQ